MTDIDESMPLQSMEMIQSVLDRKLFTESQSQSYLDVFFETCKLVCHELHIKAQQPQLKTTEPKLINHLYAIARASHFRVRKVRLTSKWWLNDNGPLFGFYKGNACALLPRKQGKYDYINLYTNEKMVVNANLAKDLAKEAYGFYASLPIKITSVMQVVKFALRQAYDDYKRMMVMQFGMSLLLLIIPVATGFLFDTVIPNANINLLVQITCLLVLNIVIIALFKLVKMIALMRIRFKTTVRLQSAVWDRIMRLPVKFFRKFGAGELAFRASRISEIEEVLTNTAVLSVLSGVMSLLTLGLMFYVNVRLALASIALILIIAVVTIAYGLARLFHEKAMYDHYTTLSGIVLQLLTGISKLRVANSEARAFNVWSKWFVKKSRQELLADKVLVRLDVFNAAVAIFNVVVLYGLVYLSGDSLSFGSFIIFNAAFTLFFAAILEMTDEVSEIIEVVPLYQKVKPIFDAIPEVSKFATDPGELTGAINVDHLVFRYDPKQPPLFKNLSLSAKPGEFVALVGPSGAGKSTLFRLLLGFEDVEGGEILYDGINFNTLDVDLVRKQVGVVLQNSSLIPGTILTNIVGGDLHLTREQAWDIAREMGIEQFIRDLPMGMDTLIGEGSDNLSGGQRQLLMLARALTKKPKIIYLDEATSALDNAAQAKIQEFLDTYKITRIVAAHRLSTIKSADRIYVIDQGQVVQEGTYDELLRSAGMFTQLVKRQLI